MTTAEKKLLMKKYRRYLESKGLHNSWIGIHQQWVRMYLATDKPLTEEAVNSWIDEIYQLGLRGRNRTDSRKALDTFIAYIHGDEIDHEKIKVGKPICDMDCFNCPYPDCVKD